MKNMMYLERPGCNLCMGNQEKAEKGDTVMSTSTRLFKGRVVADSNEKKNHYWPQHLWLYSPQFWVEFHLLKNTEKQFQG